MTQLTQTSPCALEELSQEEGNKPLMQVSTAHLHEQKMIILTIFLASRQKWYLKYRHTCLNNFSRSYCHRRTMGPGFYLYFLCTQMKLTDLLSCTYFSKILHVTEIYIISFSQTCCSFKYGNVLCFFSLATHCPNHAPHSPLPYDCITPRGQLIFTTAV